MWPCGRICLPLLHANFQQMSGSTRRFVSKGISVLERVAVLVQCRQVRTITLGWIVVFALLVSVLWIRTDCHYRRRPRLERREQSTMVVQSSGGTRRTQIFASAQRRHSQPLSLAVHLGICRITSGSKTAPYLSVR